jgi:hypothetical protein
MEGTPSNWTFLKIDTLEFTFLASANMAALQQYLPVLVAGGKSAPLPQALKNKQCCIDVPSDFDQCLRHALMWPFLGFPDNHNYSHLPTTSTTLRGEASARGTGDHSASQSRLI